ncbi:unnamed protein product [Clonostachys solani]|uniref:Zn(2)-C6 fungal-type domain-containing protein n=1 Tax=Clonostachys solani TaxID=160281 RepID=A0A9P0EKF8_9HYPO|nr:unnamed protein product [Clonostachys solani]
MVSETPSEPRFSCSECKLRKVKCDRTTPSCVRCIRNGDVCHYPTVRRRNAPGMGLPSRPKISDLESRLAELEGKLRTQDHGQASRSSELPQTPESFGGGSNSSTSMAWTGRMEQLPAREQVDELTDIYFAKIHPTSPILHPVRYRASLYQPPHMQPPMCLQYTVMTLAANVSSSYIAEPFYRRARKYLETDEMMDDGYNITVPHIQAWILLSHFEAQQLWFSRASTSASMAVRILQMLGLHALDAPHGPTQRTLLPPRDWCELEERRRTFWAGFMTDRGTSATTGWPVLINAHQIQTRLPASDEDYLAAVSTGPEPQSFQDALSNGGTERSSFACRIIAMHLFHECIDSNHSNPLLPSFSGLDAEPFWMRFASLDQGIATAFATMPAHLLCPENMHDNDAVVVNLQLYTSTICLYRAATSRVKSASEDDADAPLRLPIDANERVQVAAQQITSILAMAMDIHTRFRNPFTAFAAFMAAFVFIKRDHESGTRSNMDKVNALMDMMVTIGSENAMTASLAVQLAHELMKTGLDPLAMNKVYGLMSMMDQQVPLLGKESEKDGAVVFCPMEERFGKTTH